MASHRYAALLRGINVGGKNLLPMSALGRMFEVAGCTDVKTYIQSGNVVFGADAKRAARVPEVIARALSEGFGLRVPVVLRSDEELRAVVAGNPYLPASGPELLHVGFLAALPDAEAIAALDPARSTPDEFSVRGREIFLRLPNGVARSKLTNAWFDRALGTTSTLRNWRTVLKLAEMTG